MPAHHISSLGEKLDMANRIKELLVTSRAPSKLFSPSTETYIVDDLTFRQLENFYSEPSPRSTFQVRSTTNVDVFLKLNSNIQKIETETRVADYLNACFEYDISYPGLINNGIESNMHFDFPFAWIAYDWISSKQVIREQKHLLHSAARELALLHTPEFNFDLAEEVFETTLPSAEQWLVTTRKKYQKEFQITESLAPEELREELSKIASSFLEEKITNERVCLNHGDFHVNNILFEEHKNKPIIIDWEDATIESPYFDIGHFFVLHGFSTGMCFLQYYTASLPLHIASTGEKENKKCIYRMAGLWIARELRWKARFLSKKELRIYCDEKLKLLQMLYDYASSS